jgi:hypothetical protein
MTQAAAFRRKRSSLTSKPLPSGTGAGPPT